VRSPGRGMIEDEKALDRVVFFSDAVFAIAMTLLVVELRVPILAAGLGDRVRNERLAHALGDLEGALFSFALSFFVLGLLWMAHHRKFRLIRRYDDRLLWLNLAFLFCVAFLPFPTAVLGRYGDLTATVFYAASMAVAGLLSALITLYAYSGHRLIASDVDPRSITHWIWRSLVVPIVFLASIPVAFVSVAAAQALWALSFAATFSLVAVHGRRTSAEANEG
jgi:uncharacterized membrane protein